MKTKLTLFVAVLASVLFGMGCTSVPKPDVANAVKWNGHWYAVLPEPCNWETAIKRCERLGGHLAFVETEAENEFIANLLKEKPAWLGGIKQETGWKWLNGKPITKLFFDKQRNQPDGRHGENYLMTYFHEGQSGRWGDDVERGPLWVICEWE